MHISLLLRFLFALYCFVPQVRSFASSDNMAATKDESSDRLNVWLDEVSYLSVWEKVTATAMLSLTFGSTVEQQCFGMAPERRPSLTHETWGEDHTKLFHQG